MEGDDDAGGREVCAVHQQGASGEGKTAGQEGLYRQSRHKGPEPWASLEWMMPGVWWGHSCIAPCKTPEPHLVLQHGKEALRMITAGSPTNLGKLGLRVKLSGYTSHFGASLVAQMVKNLPAMQEIQVQSLSWEDPLPTPVFLPEEFHGPRSLVGYIQWECKESETTE